MKFLYKDIEAYFEVSLPGVEVVTEALVNHAFEVEEIVECDNDFELDVKILPDRAVDAKNALGLAREVAAILEFPLKSEYKINTSPETARTTIDFITDDISNLVGVSFTTDDVMKYLLRVGVFVENNNEKLIAYIPVERPDLNMKEDLADEVARLYGYDKIPAKILKPQAEKLSDHPDFTLANQIRVCFANHGFTEVYGYTFTSKGVVEIEKPLASDKAFLRTNLTDWMEKTIISNIKYSLFPKDQVNLFEIGNTFPTIVKEEKWVCLASNQDLSLILSSLQAEFKVEIDRDNIKKIGSVQLIEIPLTAFTLKNTNPDLVPYIKEAVTYKPVSPYPRIIRDVALFVPTGTKSGEVAEVIKQSAGELLAEGPVLFDEFTKPGEERTSLAYRMAFQASDRTLSDEEINEIMDGVYNTLKVRGWEVR